MAFDLTKPSMTDPDWPTCFAYIRENFRAIAQDDFRFSGKIGIGVTPVAASHALSVKGSNSNGALEFGNQAGDASFIASYDRANAVYRPTIYQADGFLFRAANGSDRMKILSGNATGLAIAIAGTSDDVTFAGDTYRTGAETGRCGMRFHAPAASAEFAFPVNFKHRRVSVPTVSITPGATTNNVATRAANSVSVHGFLADYIGGAGIGSTYSYEDTYTTSA